MWCSTSSYTYLPTTLIRMNQVESQIFYRTRYLKISWSIVSIMYYTCAVNRFNSGYFTSVLNFNGPFKTFKRLSRRRRVFRCTIIITCIGIQHHRNADWVTHLLCSCSYNIRDAHTGHTIYVVSILRSTLTAGKWEQLYL